ncbi:NADH dehydrogenase [ubiquinone] 1 alpha subcomplex assembly factor 3-like [Sitodiplosis mosellana]|uniref:NADH dehydrogenase [ubiquinone] 1 alpha subcomplex assembly factor 3-like n=1 Tax=Sitodiplosis mosellana TaxID=263140 RepID=UPI0024448809|nr:NADH dehydrogenase [ubiquinone] 1 alpha subcomplex assembly factor 3-like [Sitodiplosis mosellana]
MFRFGKEILFQNVSLIRRFKLNQPQNKLTNRLYSSSYEGDGKTKVKVLNNDPDMGLMVNSFSELGFRLNNKFSVVGPMVIFPRTVLSWNVNSVDDINEHSLRLLLALDPKLELLIIGTGDKEVTPELTNAILSIVKPYGIRIELLKTDVACTTFNFMNAESRFIAAALIPPKKLKFNDMDLLAVAERQKQLYGPDEHTIKITS